MTPKVSLVEFIIFLMAAFEPTPKNLFFASSNPSQVLNEILLYIHHGQLDKPVNDQQEHKS